MLIENNFHSLPVRDKRKQVYLKFLDLQDFIQLLSNEFTLEQVSSEDFPVLVKEAFEKRVVDDVCNISERNPWYPLDKAAPLRKAIGTSRSACKRFTPCLRFTPCSLTLQKRWSLVVCTVFR